jgi:hypothetical protein
MSGSSGTCEHACCSSGEKERQTREEKERQATEEKERQESIRCLNRNISAIKHLSEPLGQFFQFEQTCLTPQTRALCGVNYMMMAMYGLKGGIKAWIDQDYSDIKNPPPTLKENIDKVYTDIDKVVAKFEESMKEIITMIQTTDPTGGNTPKPAA